MEHTRERIKTAKSFIIMANGKMMSKKEKGNIAIQIKICMKDIGKIIKDMVMGSMTSLQEKESKGNGSTMFYKEKYPCQCIMETSDTWET